MMNNLLHFTLMTYFVISPLLDVQLKIWVCKTCWEAQFYRMLVKGHIWGVQVFLFSRECVCVCWFKIFGGDGAAGCLGVCVCVCVRLLWGAQNARWCLLNSKSSPTLDWSSAVWTTCCLEWPASIQTGGILQHPKLPAASVFSQALSASLSSAACRQKLPVNEGYRSSARRN